MTSPPLIVHDPNATLCPYCGISLPWCMTNRYRCCPDCSRHPGETDPRQLALPW